MLTVNNSVFLRLTRHILKWEGKTSSDPRDTAAKCFPGGIHTNKGITYCTFKELANKVGISPVTHARFLKLTNAEVNLFIYEFYKMVNGASLKPFLSIAATEAAWASGASRANAQLRETARALGLPARTTAEAVKNLALVSDLKAFQTFQKIREDFYRKLGATPLYSWALKGWLNRINDFNSKFKPVAMLPFFFSVTTYLFFG